LPVLIAALAIVVAPLCAQAPGTDADARMSVQEPVLKTESNRCSPNISEKSIFRNLLCDQKAIFSAPLHSGRHLRVILPLAGITAALIASDKYVGRSLTDGSPGTAFKISRGISQMGTAEATFAFAGAYYGISRVTRNERMRKTALLSVEALADAGVVQRVLKAAANRERPADTNGLSIENGRGAFWGGGSSFISGHATTVWALASVFAARYPDKRWVRYASYGLAGLVSISRIPARRHFPSDVVVGSAFGYLIGQYVARNQGR
jgi:membrane-associated phospholipid phosphatase